MGKALPDKLFADIFLNEFDMVHVNLQLQRAEH